MGGAVSELRHSIQAHVVIAQQYTQFIEPMLVVVQFFLRTAEIGEGADPDRPVEDIPIDVVIADKRVFEEASTEIELLVENERVTQTLLQAIQTHRSLVLAPDLDPLKRWYDPPWQKDKPMPKFVDITPDDVPRFQVAVLRTSIRCLRLMMFCTDARRVLEALNGPAILNDAVATNALDDFVRTDVKAIFAAVYGGDNAVRRIAIADVQVTVEMMRENLSSAIVQLAGVQRLCNLLASANALLYTPHVDTNDKSKDANKSTAASLFRDIDTFGAVALATSALRRFAVDKYLRLFVHVCRFIAFVAVEEHNAKMIGQEGGVEGVVALLFHARSLQRALKQHERDAATRETKRRASALSDWNSILQPPVGSSGSSDPAAPPNSSDASADKGTIPATSIASLATVDWTPTEVGQQAMWALDLLAALPFNVSQMKRHRLKYILDEIRLDPDGRALGAALIVTRRLRLIRWDDVGADVAR